MDQEKLAQLEAEVELAAEDIIEGFVFWRDHADVAKIAALAESVGTDVFTIYLLCMVSLQQTALASMASHCPLCPPMAVYK